MVKVTYITFGGKEQVVDVPEGRSLMEGAVMNSVEGIAADCGGNCYCASCRIYAVPEWRERIGKPSDYEKQLLDAIGDETPAVRLSCQVSATQELNGLVVTLPESQK